MNGERGELEAVAYCHACRDRTRWVFGRGGSFSRCEGCADRFPCLVATCGHGDCEHARDDNERDERRASNAPPADVAP